MNQDGTIDCIPDVKRLSCTKRDSSSDAPSLCAPRSHGVEGEANAGKISEEKGEACGVSEQ